MNTHPTDKRNVVDKYKTLALDEIKSELKSKAFPFAVCGNHIEGDYNLSCIMRAANAFNAKEFFYFGGKKKFDPRGAVGTHHYMDVTHLKTLEELSSLKNKYTIIGVDNVPGALAVDEFTWPENSLMLFGEENLGLLKEELDLCNNIVYIKQYGSVRSLNVAVAAGIIMQDYVTKYVRSH